MLSTTPHSSMTPQGVWGGGSGMMRGREEAKAEKISE